ncbi:PstS family phosphate ABC transporter substrate-binding protein [Natronolimnohabitans sp. A-GB9]|uniref:PstS family phosphate ABC transporter substrate-binding protein n=1 Tax=Natronolimnohabitans sp. A-GB9 TaxID=3069757 RepID=UPI0027B50EA2|nr:PstS family phosphate ABC transporter substrate-binding protein [Natronolimnohabitans sp. A-GB9]MDQ2051615.1 PstS family phosphate ABC transporter substrate-binding protein [Natronolimnohabitans sp. A-GB9]
MGTDPISGGDGVSRRRVLLGVAGSSLMGLSGCIVHGEDSGLDGEIVIDGSNTLLPNSALVAELFNWQNNQVEIPVRGSGTGAGFQQFCRGETDLQNASREIADDERELCDSNGVDWIQLEVIRDGLAIMKHPDNDWCDCLTTDQLRELWQSGSDVETWQDLDDDWPDEEISLYGRDTASGTFDYFTETINGNVGDIRSDYSGTPDTNAIVRGVRGNRHAIGFGGAGYYYENEDDLDLIAVDDGDGCVYPDPEAIEEGTYTPLSRPMYLYVREQALEREAVRTFLRFYLDNTQETARDVGFYAVPDETIEAQHEKLDELTEEYE